MALLNWENEDLWSVLKTKVNNIVDFCNNLAGSNGSYEDVNKIFPPIGVALPYFGLAVPNDRFMLCNGQAVSRVTYATLFSLIGTSYGIGDGSTTFNLPNTKGRFLVGYDPGNADYNDLTSLKVGGLKEVTLTLNQIPPHTHTSVVNSGNIAAGGSSVSPVGAGNTGSAGGGEPHENRPPYLTSNYIIRVK
jgi:microcystin-dependent protein